MLLRTIYAAYGNIQYPYEVSYQKKKKCPKASIRGPSVLGGYYDPSVGCVASVTKVMK